MWAHGLSRRSAAAARATTTATAATTAASCLPGGRACFFTPTLARGAHACGDVTEYCDTTGVTAPNLDCLGMSGAVAGNVAGEGDADRLRARLLERARLEQRQGAGVRRGDGDGGRSGDRRRRVRHADGDARSDDAARLRRRRRQGLHAAAGERLRAAGLQRRARRARRRSKYCRDNGAGGECSDRLRWESRYSIANIPTNTRLVIRVTGPSADERRDLGDDGGVQHLPVDERSRMHEPVRHRLPRHRRTRPARSISST